MTRPVLSRLTLLQSALAQIAFLASATPVLADPRVEQVFFDADKVVNIRGQSNVQTMVEFAADERIENIALGDAVGWQVTPNKRGNLLFLKPMAARAHTNMTVVTDQRRYLFDLVNGGPRARPVYVLRFVFPVSLPLALDTSSKVSPQPETTMPPPTTAQPAPVFSRNTAWRATGASQLFPTEIFDDGNATYLAWSATRDLPAILAAGADGQEGPVNFAVRDATIVIEGVASRYVLRIGKASATLTRLVPLPGRTANKSKEPAL
ncbi:TrbG/VirB9 family P-type conjugative transfer protein [Novosphingobium sp.]|uniref:TrbG/VirB9 family P-type conjugative transfer protein n=1 Tax=Novosphingobium sp. TaxID=1874826 RepID=UPI0026105836|nr:TrbG/VirB9 family P-type conjugative transfer protein [Novosphingobium sp.]